MLNCNITILYAMIRGFILFILLYYHNTAVMCKLNYNVYPRRSEVEYMNDKYFVSFNVSVRRPNRHSPYIAYVDIASQCPFGNNVTARLQLYENLSGRYNPTMIRFEYKLCDWLNNDVILGQLWKSRLPANSSCPFPKTHLKFTSSFSDFNDRFDFNLPFTWDQYCISVRMNVDVFGTKTKEMLLKFNTHFDIIQKPIKETTKIKKKALS